MDRDVRERDLRQHVVRRERAAAGVGHVERVRHVGAGRHELCVDHFGQPDRGIDHLHLGGVLGA